MQMAACELQKLEIRDRCGGSVRCLPVESVTCWVVSMPGCVYPGGRNTIWLPMGRLSLLQMLRHLQWVAKW